jgi:tRNA(Ile)-lysidine synthase
MTNEPRRWSEQTLRGFPPDQRYLIGVSGGRDSVALLHWLTALGYRNLVVCHLDHGLRARSSAADARFVQKLAATNNLTCELGKADVRHLAADTKQSLEAAARSARYSFFAKVARRRRCHTIFLGHHADDLVETFLINLFRGAGSSAQRGIRPISVRTVEKVELVIVRPLLEVWRAEIDDYVEVRGLRYREDASNRQLDALRNRMRHRIIPELEKELGRGIRKTVSRMAIIAAEEDAFLSDALPQTSARLPLRELRAMPLALQRRALTRWLRSHDVADVGFEMVERVRRLLDVAGPAKVNLTEDRHARRRAGELFIEEPKAKKAAARQRRKPL